MTARPPLAEFSVVAVGALLPMTNDPPAIAIRRLDRVGDDDIRQLSDVLIDCVTGGASVSFMAPMTAEKAEAFWRRVAVGVSEGLRILLVADVGGRIVGTVQLVLDLPENQPHRADVSKLLVHREFRGRRIGDRLMAAVETEAKSARRSLLVLDTASPAAEAIYRRQGWVASGVVPNFALLPDGGYCDTTFFYRELSLAD